MHLRAFSGGIESVEARRQGLRLFQGCGDSCFQEDPVISERKRFKPAFKVWLENDEGSYVFGEGPFNVLKKVQELGILSEVAEALSMSYRHAWGLVKEAENLIGGPLLETRKGGTAGGGGARLTRAGEEFLKDFSRVKESISKFSLDEFGWEDLFVKFSARNRIEGEVISVEKDRVSAVVKIGLTFPML